MDFDQAIFKTYDIRGIYPDQLNEPLAYAIARGYAAWLKNSNPGQKLTVAVASDMRVSSPPLKEQVIRGLLEGGLNVVDIGLASTPTYYFAVANFNYDGGVQISASHNPKQYNGLKMVTRGAVPLGAQTGLDAIKQKVLADDFSASAEPGQLQTKDNITGAAVDYFSKQVDISTIKPLKIVADAANSMGALDLAALFAKLPGELIKMNFELDGTFPAHEADPLKPENMADLQQRVVAEKAQLGIATDGDGDRIFFVDDTGAIVPQPIIRGLMAQIELREHPGSLVAYDIRPGRITADMIAEAGGKAVVTKVGHTLIKQQMIKDGAIFGGESSGHFFYKLPFGTFEAPMLLVLKLLQYLSQQDRLLSQIIKPYLRYAHSGEVNTKVPDRTAVSAIIEKIKARYADGQQTFLDGLSVEYPDYWFSVRASNTESLIRLIVESPDQKIMEQKRDEILQIIRT